MKKLKYIVLPLIAFILVACGHSTKKEFIQLIEGFNQPENSSIAFDISLKDIEQNSNTKVDFATKALINILESNSLSVEAHKNQTAKTATVTIGLSSDTTDTTKMDMHVFNDQVYVSGKLFKLISQLQDPSLSEMFNGVQEYYLSLTELSSLTNQDISFINLNNLFADTTSTEKVPTIYEYLNNNAFKEEGNFLIATITYDEYKKIVSEHKVSESISFSEFEKYATDMTIVTKINKETKEVTVDVALDLNEQAPLPLDKATIVLELHTIPYVEPKTLTNDEILTAAEFQKALEQNFKLSDKEFEELYNTMKESIASIADEKKQEYLANNQHLFTEEQLKKLQELFFPNQPPQ